MFYGSRFYDPLLARWAQPDSIIPGVGEGGNPNAVGCLGAANYSPLTVDYHENQLLEQLNHENRVRLRDAGFRLPPVPTNSIAFDRYAYSLNNPIRYTDPTGHCPFCATIALTLGGVTPLGWVAIGGSIAYFVFVALGGPEAIRDALYQGGEAASNGINVLLAKKPDIRFADYLQKKYGLTDAQRRALHDAITRQGLTNKEIEAEAAEMARLNQEKQKDNQQKEK